MRLELRNDLARVWQTAPFGSADAFAAARAQQGTIYRDKEGRRTLRFEAEGRGYFLKLHQGVGWGEIIKNLLQLRLPVVGARNEYEAIRALERLGLATLTIAGYGERGWNPARRLSFLVTDELADVVSLEDYCRPWREQPPAPALRQQLIRRVAEISRTLHESGINHRDFYLCHFLLERGAEVSTSAGLASRRIYLMDLHRAQIRARVPRRWLIKDLGALYNSALDIGLTRNDVLRFLRSYRGAPLRAFLPRERAFWEAVKERAGRIYRRDFQREPQWPL